jgi:hypothetical protein
LLLIDGTEDHTVCDGELVNWAFWGLPVKRCGGMFALRCLVSAVALVTVYSADSFAGCAFPPCGGTTTPTQAPAPPSEAVAIVFEANGFTQSTGSSPPISILKAQAQTPTFQEMAQEAALNVSNTDPESARYAKVLVAELKAIRIVEKGGTPSDALASIFWGPWSSVVTAGNAIGDTPLNMLYNLAYTTYASLLTAASNAARARAGLNFTEEQPSGFPDDIALAYASVLRSPPPATPAFHPQWSFWASAIGGYGRMNGNPASGTTTLISRAFGGTFGAEYQFSPNTKAGIAVSGTGSNWGDAAGGSGTSNAANVNLYATTRQDRAYVSGWLNVNDNWLNTARFTGGDEVVGKFSAQTYGARLEGGYRYPVMATFGVTPYAGLQLQYLHTPAYNETDLAGGGMGFSYGAMNGTDTRSELGARFDTTQIVNLGIITWSARAAWAHDWLNNFGVGSVFQAVPTTAFVANGAALLPTDSALLSLEANLALASKWTIAAKFDSQLAEGFQTYAGTATLRYAW